MNAKEAQNMSIDNKPDYIIKIENDIEKAAQRGEFDIIYIITADEQGTIITNYFQCLGYYLYTSGGDNHINWGNWINE